MEKRRCDWVGATELDIDYHDQEWGREVHDDAVLFEFLFLESMQAGLSWATILKKREGFRNAFDGFDYKRISQYQEDKLDSLMTNSQIIRHKLKIKSAVTNAIAFINIQKEYGSFDRFIWGYVDNKPIINHFKALSEVPATTELSNKISKDLKKKGFKFLGATSVYAFMQAAGIVDDHMDYCFCKNNK